MLTMASELISCAVLLTDNSCALKKLLLNYL